MNKWSQAVFRNQFSLSQVIDSYETVLAPRLETALGTAYVTKAVLGRRMAKVWKAVRKVAGCLLGDRLTQSAMSLVFGIGPLSEKQTLRSATRACLRLSYRAKRSGQTAWSRVQQATGSPSRAQAQLALSTQAWRNTLERRHWKGNRIVRALRDLQRLGIFMEPSFSAPWNPTPVQKSSGWDWGGKDVPRKVSPDILSSPLIETPSVIEILSVSDGSTDPFRRSGTAVVQRITSGLGEQVTRRFICPLRNTGENYVAEAAGVALQLHLAPRKQTSA